MRCTIKEQETCDVEKRGCKGCYYDDKDEKTMDILQNLKNGEQELLAELNK